MVTNAWIDEKEKRIYINTNNVEQFQKEIPKLIVEKELILKSFYQPESSLQEVFLEIINKDEGKYNGL